MMELAKEKKAKSKQQQINGSRASHHVDHGLEHFLNSFKPPQAVSTAQNASKIWAPDELNAPLAELSLEKEFGIIDKISAFLKETSGDSIMRGTVSSPAVFDAENATSNTHIDSLPVEILCKIMDCLEFSDRKNASLVCRKWRNAILESYFLKDILIKANNHLLVSSRPSSSVVPATGSLLTTSNHRAASSMAMSAYSTTPTFNIHLYSNVVNLEFENDSADVALLLKNLNAYSSANSHTPSSGNANILV